MKKCSECNTEMRIGKLFGEPFKMDMDHDIDEARGSSYPRT